MSLYHGQEDIGRRDDNIFASSKKPYTIQYEQVSSRHRILDLRVFRGFSMSANEYILEQKQRQDKQQQQEGQGELTAILDDDRSLPSYEDAVLQLTLDFDDKGRDRKLVEYYKNSKESKLDHVVHFVAIAIIEQEEEYDNNNIKEEQEQEHEHINKGCNHRTNGVIASIDAQIQRQCPANPDCVKLPVPYISLKNLKVHSIYRRQGIASALVQIVKDYAKKSGISSIVLEVDPSNHGAVRLYEKEGFVELNEPFSIHGKMVYKT